MCRFHTVWMILAEYESALFARDRGCEPELPTSR